MRIFRLSLYFLSLCGIVIWGNPIFAGTTVTPTTLVPTLTIPTASLDSLVAQFQDRMDKNGPAFADGFAMASTLGYAIGKSTLGDFPHFQIGLSLNAGLTNMQNFQHSKTGNYNGTLPGIGLAPAFTVGIGLGGGVDVIGKFLMFNQDLYTIPTIPYANIKIDKYSFYEIGGRIRYNAVKEKTIVPFLFSFGGITFSAGGDFSRGIVGSTGNYTMPYAPFDVDVGGTLYTVTPDLNSTYRSKLTWYEISGTTQALAYFSFFQIVSLYTGVGLTVGYGWFSFDFDASGSLDISTSDPLYAVISSPPISYTGTSLATVDFTSKNKYHPKSVFPTYIVGLELDIPFVKLITESQVNLRNRADVTVTLGLRVQI